MFLKLLDKGDRGFKIDFLPLMHNVNGYFTPTNVCTIHFGAYRYILHYLQKHIDSLQKAQIRAFTYSPHSSLLLVAFLQQILNEVQ